MFRSDPGEAFTDPDFERIKDPEIRAQVKAAWDKKAAALLSSDVMGSIGAEGVLPLKAIKNTDVGNKDHLSGFTDSARQSVAEIEQKNANNPSETVAAVRPHGEVLFDKTGTRRTVQIPHDSIGQLRGAALVHSHPDGTPPSVTDFWLSCQHQIAVLCVPTPNGVYRLTPYGATFLPHIYDSVSKELLELQTTMRGMKTMVQRSQAMHKVLIGIARRFGMRYSYSQR